MLDQLWERINSRLMALLTPPSVCPSPIHVTQALSRLLFMGEEQTMTLPSKRHPNLVPCLTFSSDLIFLLLLKDKDSEVLMLHPDPQINFGRCLCKLLEILHGFHNSLLELSTPKGEIRERISTHQLLQLTKTCFLFPVQNNSALSPSTLQLGFTRSILYTPAPLIS